MKLTLQDIDVVYKTYFKYTDSRIKDFIKIEIYNKLCSRRNTLEEQIETINAKKIRNLGIEEKN